MVTSAGNSTTRLPCVVDQQMRRSGYLAHQLQDVPAEFWVNPGALRLKPGNLIADVRNQPFALGAREDSQRPDDLNAELCGHAPAVNLIYEQELGVKFSGQDNCRGFAGALDTMGFTPPPLGVTHPGQTERSKPGVRPGKR